MAEPQPDNKLISPTHTITDPLELAVHHVLGKQPSFSTMMKFTKARWQEIDEEAPAERWDEATILTKKIAAAGAKFINAATTNFDSPAELNAHRTNIIQQLTAEYHSLKNLADRPTENSLHADTTPGLDIITEIRPAANILSSLTSKSSAQIIQRLTDKINTHVTSQHNPADAQTVQSLAEDLADIVLRYGSSKPAYRAIQPVDQLISAAIETRIPDQDSSSKQALMQDITDYAHALAAARDNFMQR